MIKRILGITACLTILPGLVATADDAALRERFIKEYPPAAERLAQRFRREGTNIVVYENQSEQNGVLSRENVKYTFRRRGENIRLDEEPFLRTAVNPAQARPIKWKHDLWLMANGKVYYARQKAANEPFDIIRGAGSRKILEVRTNMHLESPLRIAGSLLSDLCLKPNEGSIEQISEFKSDDDRTLVKVEFRRVRRAENGEGVEWGWFAVDPDNQWVLDSYHYENSLGHFSDGKLTYKRNASGEIEPDLWEETFRNPKFGMRSVRTRKYEGFQPEPVPEEFFQPKSLGLEKEEEPTV